MEHSLAGPTRLSNSPHNENRVVWATRPNKCSVPHVRVRFLYANMGPGRQFGFATPFTTRWNRYKSTRGSDWLRSISYLPRPCVHISLEFAQL